MKKLIYISLCIAVCLFCFATLSQAGIIAFGQVTDPNSDQKTGTYYCTGGNCELVSATISIYDTGIAEFQVQYAPGSFNGDSLIGISLDIDQNASSGGLWHGIGVEYVIDIKGANFQGNGAVSAYPYWTENTFPVTYLTDGVQFSIPMSFLGNDDGLFDYIVSAQNQLTDGSSTYIADLMPSNGFASTSVPEPTTLLLYGLGFAGAGVYRRLRKR